MSKRVADALPAEQRDFLIGAARDSLPLMRASWDELVDKSRAAVRGAGIEIRAIDREAFRAAVKPLLDRYLRDPAIERFYRMLRDAA
jgi:TRAP-type C4-dicarboxylate transport system substrate-binding protein